ncbi:MAG: hypothetical protein H6573_15345 [Lewinellaceae bacterium]|nr:hypothetical protein [Lewinellaceae bacterium]
MPLKLILSIALFLLWGFVSWRWYVCGIKQACPEPPHHRLKTSVLWSSTGAPRVITRPPFDTI